MPTSELYPVPPNLESDVTIRGLNTSQQVFGRYQLRHILGRGGMGIVWLAQDERLDREVALKFLPDEVFFDPVALDELKRETRRCLDLTHANIIRIYDFIKDEQAAAISMEYIDGKTLAELRIEKPNRIFEVDEIRGWIASVCQALQYAHAEAGVVHRDLKPANLMLTSRGQLKIADFGIAQSMADSLSRRTIKRGTSSGTLAYMSPEQLNGEVARPADDIYALGATIYELLTGKPPFHSGDVGFQIRLSIPKSVAERRTEFDLVGDAVPSAWEDTLRDCLSKLPSERPASMQNVAERLGLALPVAAPRPHLNAPATRTRATTTSPGKMPPPLPTLKKRARPTLSISLIGVALLLALVAAAYFRPRLPLATGSSPALEPSTAVAYETGSEVAGSVAPALDPAPVVPDKSGSFHVSSTPSGATVRVSGQHDQVTPATFSNLSPGRYLLTISADGYDPAQSTVNVTSQNKTEVGTLELRRSMGDLSIDSIPSSSHYVLVGTGATAGMQKNGTTPDVLLSVPTGSYRLTLTSPGLPAVVSNLVILAHRKISSRVDLVDDTVTRSATPATVAVFHGTAPLSSLNDTQRGELTGLANQAFTRYLTAGLLDQAAHQLDLLRSLGQDTSLLQAQLVSKSSAEEQMFAGEIQRWVATRKFATAREVLRDLQATLDPNALSRIEAPYRDQLATYQTQIDAAVQASQTQPPALADGALRALIKQYPDDPQLQVAKALILTRQPPQSVSLAAQNRAFQQFELENKTLASDPALVALEHVFLDEQKQLEQLTLSLKAAKKGPASLRAEIDDLEDRKRQLHLRQVGRSQQDPFSTAINFFGKAVTGHRVVDNAAYFASTQDKRDAIAEVQAKINQDQAALTQTPTSLTDAQARYDLFMARVPWDKPDQTTPAIPNVAPAPQAVTVTP